MAINIIGRQLEITPAIKTYTEGQLQPFLDMTSLKVTSISATMEFSKGHFDVVLVLNCKSHTLTATTNDFDLYKALDAAVDKLESQCASLKGKIQEHHADPVSTTDIKIQSTNE
ncbi:MAG: ribosome-associated translation inhibitor RaiA [Lentisphaeria bacterium]|nr:ribosome-associated translation inhibitor RaiA [Lentisphaeria bacterium]